MSTNRLAPLAAQLRRGQMLAAAIRTRLRIVHLLRDVALDDVLWRLTPPPRRRPSAARQEELLQAAAVVRATLLGDKQRFVPSTCLTRSLTLFHVLRQHGVPVQFVMGIRPEAVDLEGHAWLELDNVPVYETIDTTWRITFRHPEPADA